MAFAQHAIGQFRMLELTCIGDTCMQCYDDTERTDCSVELATPSTLADQIHHDLAGEFDFDLLEQ